MLATVFAAQHAQIASLELEVERRRKISLADPVADGISHAVAEFRETLRLLESESEWLSPEQYGEIHAVSAQTVRNWIARGELKAERTAKGFKIARSSRRQRLEKAMERAS